MMWHVPTNFEDITTSDHEWWWQTHSNKSVEEHHGIHWNGSGVAAQKRRGNAYHLMAV